MPPLNKKKRAILRRWQVETEEIKRLKGICLNFYFIKLINLFLYSNCFYQMFKWLNN